MDQSGTLERSQLANAPKLNIVSYLFDIAATVGNDLARN